MTKLLKMQFREIWLKQYVCCCLYEVMVSWVLLMGPRYSLFLMEDVWLRESAVDSQTDVKRSRHLRVEENEERLPGDIDGDR